MVLKSRGHHSPKLPQIQRYIQSFDDYSLQKPVRRSFKRVRVIVSGLRQQYDADLADMVSLAKYNSGTRYLLIVIDVFTRFLWVEPIKNKTGKTVLEAFKIFFENCSLPKKIRSDKGREFNNSLLKKMVS